MEAIVILVSFGFVLGSSVVGFLLMIVLELQKIRAGIDSCRQMVADAIGIPRADPIEERKQEVADVIIPRSLRELVADDNERRELENP